MIINTMIIYARYIIGSMLGQNIRGNIEIVEPIIDSATYNVFLKIARENAPTITMDNIDINIFNNHTGLEPYINTDMAIMLNKLFTITIADKPVNPSIIISRASLNHLIPPYFLYKIMKIVEETRNIMVLEIIIPRYPYLLNNKCASGLASPDIPPG